MRYLYGKKKLLYMSLPSWYSCIPIQLALNQNITEDERCYFGWVHAQYCIGKGKTKIF